MNEPSRDPSEWHAPTLPSRSSADAAPTAKLPPSAAAEAGLGPRRGVCDGPQGAGEGSGGRGPSDGCAGEPAGGGPGVDGVGVQPDDQHVVRGAAARDGPAPQRAEGAEDVPVQQGLARARGDVLFHALPLQLLLGGPHVAAAR